MTSTSRPRCCSSGNTWSKSEASELGDRIDKALESLDLDLPSGSGDRLSLLLDELERWNRKVNLTAIRDRAEMISAHLLDSLVAAPLLNGRTVLDIGTGAGFPGLPLAVARPDVEFELLDSNNKKIQFVQHAAGLLGLDNVRTVWSRTENYAPGYRFDTVIARALATVPKLLQIAGQHVGEDGVFIALKGREFADELEGLASEWEYKVTTLDVPGLETGSRHAVLLKKK